LDKIITNIKQTALLANTETKNTNFIPRIIDYSVPYSAVFFSVLDSLGHPCTEPRSSQLNLPNSRDKAKKTNTEEK